jgi:adenylyltransferase/sulfurtransferase
VNFRELAARLPSGSRPTHNQYMLKFTIEPHHVTLFADGRAIIQGTSDAAAARSVYARYIGS